MSRGYEQVTHLQSKTKTKNKHMKRQTSLIIRKMQMETTMRKQYLTIRLAEMKRKKWVDKIQDQKREEENKLGGAWECAWGWLWKLSLCVCSCVLSAGTRACEDQMLMVEYSSNTLHLFEAGSLTNSVTQAGQWALGILLSLPPKVEITFSFDTNTAIECRHFPNQAIFPVPVIIFPQMSSGS